MHFDLAEHPTSDTIRLLAGALERTTRANDQMQVNSLTAPSAHSQKVHRRSMTTAPPSPYNRFHARSIPTISISAYLTRIFKYCPCTNECFLALLAYFERMAKPHTQSPLHINSYNIHRLIISGVMIASKLFSDTFFTNTRYAKVGGLHVSELNMLEIDFLQLNHYEMFITVEELQLYADRLLYEDILTRATGTIPLDYWPNDIAQDVSQIETTTSYTRSRQLSIGNKEHAEDLGVAPNHTPKSLPGEGTKHLPLLPTQTAKHLDTSALPTPPGSCSSTACGNVAASPSPSSSHESRSF